MAHQVVVKGKASVSRSGSVTCSCGWKRNGISRRWANELARQHRKAMDLQESYSKKTA